MEPKKFSELGITVPDIGGYAGDKIDIKKILNKSIVVYKFKLEPSKKKTGEFATLQLTVDGVKRILWTQSRVLIEMLKKIKAEDFPISTIIICDDSDRYLFT